ncbi:MAG TPA: RsmB/NOP family class I SAM-dependent RNA methyltransferase [Burkholderiales bacterium]|nr:RsmB/NOP family class I SAM-dependent RNA methyltransferase [Burkholderiales bacterium]
MHTTNYQLSHIIDALRMILPMEAPADVALRHFFRDRPKLGSRERAQVAEMVYAILRRRRLLEALAPKGTPRELALLALIKLDGANMREVEPLLKRGEAEWLAKAKGVDMTSLPFAVQADLPDWIAEKLVAQYGEPETLTIAAALRESAPLDLRVNTLLASREEVLKQFEQEGVKALPTPYSPIGVRLVDKLPLQKHPLFLAGKVEVQDEGSQLLGLLLAPKRRDMVVDFCAGAGGKTLLIGALMQTQGRIYAFDVSEKRLNNLKPRLARSGLSNVQPQRIDSERDSKIKRLAGKMDRVLVDAPCSGLGTLRRNPDLKWRQTPEDLVELAAKQRAILHSAATLVKAGGRLVYGTCSLLREENEEVVEDFLANHADFFQINAQEALAKQHVQIDCGESMRLMPHHHGTDGFFAVAFERKANVAVQEASASEEEVDSLDEDAEGA